MILVYQLLVQIFHRMGYSKKKCYRTRVTKLWNNDPHCHWCNVKTIRVKLGQRTLDPYSATFDHLYHKSNPLRHTRKGRSLGVLACYDCNQRRGRDAHIASLPAWNRLLIKYKLPIPVWKVRKKIGQLKCRYKRLSKILNKFKRYIKYRLKRR